MAKSDCDKCPCCSQRVKVSTADEGTSCYIGTERDEALEDAAKFLENSLPVAKDTIQTHLLAPMKVFAQGIRAMKGER